MELYVDTKTTGKSNLTPDSIPFYVKNSQLMFLKELNKNNYTLARLNLNYIESFVRVEVQPEDKRLKDFEFRLMGINQETYVRKIEEHTDFLVLSWKDMVKK